MPTSARARKLCPLPITILEAYVADLAEIVREATRMIAQIEDSMEVIRAELSLIDFVNTNFGK